MKDEKAKKAKEKARIAKKQQKDKRRHERTYAFLRFTLRRPLAAFFRCDIEQAPEVEGSYLVLSNHNTDYDFLFAGASFKRHMYYVISEHTMQHGFASRLLRYFISPISRLKGTTASSTAMNIIRTLRSGSNVCLFAEGNRSFNGETCPILPSTGKLARASGASLVTYRIDGGYMVTPRWSHSMRRGKMHAHIIGVYSPEQLRAMTDDEVNALICRDLYENAYTRQEEWRAVYKGKRLAEGLEHILFICPECGRISSMRSEGNGFSCECGLHGTYDEYGYLNGVPYRTVLDWDRWQQERLPQIIDAAESEDEVLFSDEAISLITVDEQHNPHTLVAGRLSMTKRAITLGDYCFPLVEIEGSPAIYSHASTVFFHGGVHYELKSERYFCAVKYVRAYGHLAK